MFKKTNPYDALAAKIVKLAGAPQGLYIVGPSMAQPVAAGKMDRRFGVWVICPNQNATALFCELADNADDTRERAGVLALAIAARSDGTNAFIAFNEFLRINRADLIRCPHISKLQDIYGALRNPKPAEVIYKFSEAA
jgi:hypothetical protein